MNKCKGSSSNYILEYVKEACHFSPVQGKDVR